jgi:BirA family transcriptional regulator, biotin operon repressor / biotin---[acetyl-CoA-carboxylase] ligase
LNVNAPLPADLADATSLQVAARHMIEATPMLKAFVERFDQYYGESLHGARFEERWAERLQTLGQRVRVRIGAQVIEGVAEGVNETGALLLRCADGSQIVCHAGEVTLHA